MKNAFGWTALGPLAWLTVACHSPASPSATTGDGSSSTATETEGSGMGTTGGGGQGGSEGGSDTGMGTTIGTTHGPETTGDATAGTAADEGVSESGGSSEGGVLIPCEGMCQPRFEGWNGPVMALHQVEDSLPKQCALPWGDEIAVLHDALHGEDASCSCECGEAEGVTCGPTVLHRMTSNCAAAQGTFPLAIGCNDIPTSANNSWWLEYPDPSGGSCDPVAQTDVPPAYWSQRVTLCGIDDSWSPAGECELDEQCAAPPLDDEAVCYWLEGEHECPAGDREVYYADYLDDRGCDACTCGEPEGVCGTLGNFPQGAYSDDDCTVDVGSVDESGCSHINGTLGSVHLGPVGSNTACTPNPVGPTGGVAPTGAVTLCCGFESMP